MSDTQLNIYQKLARLRRCVEYLQKDKSGYGYKYVTEAQILSKISSQMDKLGLSLLPHIVGGTTTVVPYLYKKTKATKAGEIYEENVNEILVTADMEWCWVNNDNPDERIIVPWALVGQQSDASQAFGSGLSYSSRYFLLKYFNVATAEDDVEEWRSKQKQAELEEDRLIATNIIEQAHVLVLEYLAQNPDGKPKLEEIAKKYAKDKGKPTTNYFAIKESVTASRFYNEISALVNTPDKVQEDT